MRTILAAAFSLLSLPVLASPLVGAWCGEQDGPTLFVEETGLGMGDHWVCDWGEPPGELTRIETEIACRQVYFDGEKSVVVDTRTYALEAELEDTQLRARFDDGTESFSDLYVRCDS
jgi:hypothetical protein